MQELADYKQRECKFISEWELTNPEPAFIELPKPTKPIYPIPHPSLKELSRKEKKNNPYQKIFLEKLRKYKEQLKDYKNAYLAVRSTEEAPSEKWDEDREIAIKAFRKNNFKPDSFLPEWGKLSKFETYFETGISFFYSELEILLPPQQDGNNKEYA